MGKVGAGAPLETYPCSHCPPPASFTDRPERAEGSSECPDFVPERAPNLHILLVAVLAGARPAGSCAPGAIAEREAASWNPAHRELGAYSPFLPFGEESEDTGRKRSWQKLVN